MIRQSITRGRIRRHGSRGQALVEVALVIPFFLVLFLGIVEVGRFVFYYEMVNNATREGARYAIVHGANSSTPVARSQRQTSTPTTLLGGL